MSSCTVPGCDKPHRCKGLCDSHYKKLRKWGDPLITGQMGPKPIPAEERFWAKVDKSGDCWLWAAGLDNKGYGHFTYNADGAGIGAHRYAWLITNGPIGNELTIDHICHDPKVCSGGPSCKHRRCVNPAHMALATRAENTSRQRHRNAGKTHCLNGHPYTPENTGRHPEGKGRFCLTCARARKRAAYYARKEAA